MPATPCLYARDLPLIALMGANTVRTYGLLPEGDRTFRAVLDSTDLRWLAGFPLDAFYDPARPIALEKARILDAFRKYALRFRGERRLIGYVFGEDVTEGYDRKFAGAPSDFYGLFADAAAILREIEPAGTPGLATAVGDSGEMANEVPGLSFWCWNAHSRAIPDAGKPSRPVLLSEDDGLGADLEPSGSVLGGVCANFTDAGETGIFRSSPTGLAGLDTLTARDVYYRLAGLWRGTFPQSWTEQEAPRLAAPNGTASPGVLVRLSGTALVSTAVPYADESWPYHLAGTCLCVAGAPARLSFVARRGVTAQIPAAVGPGPHPLVFYRAGRGQQSHRNPHQRVPGGDLRRTRPRSEARSTLRTSAAWPHSVLDAHCGVVLGLLGGICLRFGRRHLYDHYRRRWNVQRRRSSCHGGLPQLSRGPCGGRGRKRLRFRLRRPPRPENRYFRRHHHGRRERLPRLLR